MTWGMGSVIPNQTSPGPWAHLESNEERERWKLVLTAFKDGAEGKRRLRENSPSPTTEKREVEMDVKLGDRVRFTGTVVKNRTHHRWDEVRYEDAPLPGFESARHEGDKKWVPFRTEVGEGIVVGKRTYTSKENDEGIWSADGVQKFTAYLVAYHLSRNPVIVRADQFSELNGVVLEKEN